MITCAIRSIYRSLRDRMSRSCVAALIIASVALPQTLSTAHYTRGTNTRKTKIILICKINNFVVNLTTGARVEPGALVQLEPLH